MSYLIHWTENAIGGLKRIHDFLVAKDTEAAKAALSAIRKHALLLEKFPNAGRIAADMEFGYRELLIPFGASGYVLLYKQDKRTVYILAIRHQREVGY